MLLLYLQHVGFTGAALARSKDKEAARGQKEHLPQGVVTNLREIYVPFVTLQMDDEMCFSPHFLKCGASKVSKGWTFLISAEFFHRLETYVRKQW